MNPEDPGAHLLGSANVSSGATRRGASDDV